jgi:hypothetical protein
VHGNIRMRNSGTGREALSCSGELAQVLSLVLEARAQEPSGSGHAHWICRKLYLEVMMKWDPLRSKLEEAIIELEDYYRMGSFPQHDLFFWHAQLAMQRGEFGEGLTQFERAAAACDGDCPGYTKHYFSYLAVCCCVTLRRFAAAEDWLKAIRDQDEWDRGWDKLISAYQSSGRLLIARGLRAEYSRLRGFLRELEDVCRDMGDVLVRERLHIERVRVTMLDPTAGDPIRLLHLVCDACRVLTSSRLNVHTQFQRSLLVLDYRLACLRFCVAINPVDDEFDEGPAAVSDLGLAVKGNFDQCLRKVSAAHERARNLAAKLDGMLECSWRGREVERRAAWIKEIARAVADSRAPASDSS